MKITLLPPKLSQFKGLKIFLNQMSFLTPYSKLNSMSVSNPMS